MIKDIEKIITYVSFVFAITGLVLVVFFSPQIQYVQLTDECDGFVSMSGRITKTFYSNNDNYIAIIFDNQTTALAIVDQKFKSQDSIFIRGRASKYQNSCWIFPDEVVML